MTTARVGGAGLETVVERDGMARVGGAGLEAVVERDGMARIGGAGLEIIVVDAGAEVSRLVKAAMGDSGYRAMKTH